MKRRNRKLILFTLSGFFIVAGLSTVTDINTRAMGFSFILTGVETILATVVYNRIKKGNRNIITEMVFLIFMLLPVLFVSTTFIFEHGLFVLPLAVIVSIYIINLINKYYKLNTFLRVVVYPLVLFLIILIKLSVGGRGSYQSNEIKESKLSSDELFEKKLKCSSINIDNDIKQNRGHFAENYSVDEIFYSQTKNTCIGIISLYSETFSNDDTVIVDVWGYDILEKRWFLNKAECRGSGCATTNSDKSIRKGQEEFDHQILILKGEENIEF